MSPIEKASKPGLVITLASGKGGVGKTNLALNLSIALSYYGKNVCLFDSDLGMANVDVLLKKTPEFDLMDVLENNCSLEQAIFQGPHALNILTGGSAFENLPEVLSSNKQALADVFKRLSSFEVLVIDVGAGVSNQIMSWLRASSLPIVVATPEPTSITDAYSLLKLLHQQNGNKSVYLWLNRAKSQKHAQKCMDKLSFVCKQYLDFNIKKMGYIPEDPGVENSVAQQNPLFLCHPDCPATKSIDSVAKKISQNCERIKRDIDIDSLFSNLHQAIWTDEKACPQDREAEENEKEQEEEKLGEVLVKQGILPEDKLETALKEQEEQKSKRIGDYLMDKGFVHPEELSKATKKQELNINRKIGSILINLGIISSEQLESALSDQSSDRKKRLGEVLIEMGLISPEQLALALALKFNRPYVDLNNYPLDPAATEYISENLARNMQIFPFEVKDRHLSVAFSDPGDLSSAKDLEFHSGMYIREFIASPDSIKKYITDYYQESKSNCTQPEEELIEDEVEESDDEAQEIVEEESLDGGDLDHSSGEEKSIITLANKIVKYAIENRATDIHIQPEVKKVQVNYRIDGALHQVMQISKHKLNSLVARFKIISNMDISERRLPQDGRAKIRFGDRVVDLRFSCMPTVFGESLVIRVLDKSAGIMKIEDLGFYEREVDILRQCLNKPYGILLITGPTGSGKSSTIYSCLQEPALLGKNIITLEDPVEYEMPGIMQVQIREGIGFTFAKGLRQILRHDPDVITVGEIRDEETAKIGVQAALTGHLMFSTLHTNTAAEVFLRLTDMGVEPYLANSSIIGAVSQRLIKRVCPECKMVDEEGTKQLKMLELPYSSIGDDIIAYKGVGCRNCNNTGYKGRTNVYEVLIIQDNIKKAISQGASSGKIKELAVQNGMRPLEEIALQKIKEGVTSYEEVLPLMSEVSEAVN